MGETDIILTIGIPTWNRSQELSQTLDLLARQVSDCTTNIEVFVSDNASEDDTESVLKFFEEHYNFLRYNRNSVNMGFDANVLEIFKEARGRYVWLFGDDDFIQEGAVEKVVQIINGYAPSLIATNFKWCDSQQTLLSARRQPPRRHMVDQDQTNVSLDLALAQCNHWISFMSRLVFRRALVNLNAASDRLRNSANWLPVFLVGQVASQSTDVYLSSYYAVHGRRDGIDRFGTGTFQIGMPEVFVKISREFGVSRITEKKVLSGIRMDFMPLRQFVKAKKLGDNSQWSEFLPVPWYYRWFLMTPKFVVLWAWKLKRLAARKSVDFDGML